MTTAGNGSRRRWATRLLLLWALLDAITCVGLLAGCVVAVALSTGKDLDSGGGAAFTLLPAGIGVTLAAPWALATWRLARRFSDLSLRSRRLRTALLMSPPIVALCGLDSYAEGQGLLFVTMLVLVAIAGRVTTIALAWSDDLSLSQD